MFASLRKGIRFVDLVMGKVETNQNLLVRWDEMWIQKKYATHYTARFATTFKITGLQEVTASRFTIGPVGLFREDFVAKIFCSFDGTANVQPGHFFANSKSG